MVILAAAIIYRLVTWRLLSPTEPVVHGGAAERIFRPSHHRIDELPP
jgi:hypothetical protein